MPTRRKRREQHQQAITGYKAWLKRNPKAKRKARLQAFDAFVDSSLLEEILDAQEHTAA